MWNVKCQVTGEMPIDWSFFLSVWHSMNSLLVSVADWTLSGHQYNDSVSNKNLALHRRQNNCPGITLIFLVFSCWAIWRVITCSFLKLRQCFINTPQHLLSLLSKILPNTCSQCSIWSFLSPSYSKVLLSTNTCLPHLFQNHLQFLVKCCKLLSIFKILSKSHIIDIFLISSVFCKCSYKLWFFFSKILIVLIYTSIDLTCGILIIKIKNSICAGYCKQIKT